MYVQKYVCVLLEFKEPGMLWLATGMTFVYKDLGTCIEPVI